MKKLIMLTMSVILLAALTAGCAKPPAKADDASVAEKVSSKLDEPETEAYDNQPTTRIYVDKAGREVEIPASPKRVITVNMTAEAIALGVKPVGAAENWLKSVDDDKKEGIEPVGTAAGLNYEKILELEPDLIITPMGVTNDETLESLSKIAPTVVGPFFGDGLENLQTIGDILGKSTEAEKWIDDYNAKSAQIKAELADIFEEGKTALVVQLHAKDNTFLYPSSTWPTIYNVLGLKVPEHSELSEITSAFQISLEKLVEYDPDYIFLTSTDDANMPELKQQFSDNSVWQALSAVKSNNVYTLGARLSAGDVLTLNWALDEITRVAKEENN